MTSSLCSVDTQSLKKNINTSIFPPWELSREGLSVILLWNAEIFEVTISCPKSFPFTYSVLWLGISKWCSPTQPFSPESKKKKQASLNGNMLFCSRADAERSGPMPSWHIRESSWRGRREEGKFPFSCRWKCTLPCAKLFSPPSRLCVENGWNS